MRFVLMLFVALALTPVWAEAQKITGVFSSMEACEASTEVYTPSFMSSHKPLAAGERIVKLPQRQCGEMWIAGSKWAIVAQPAGTEMVAKGATIVRRWDCGNRARGFVVPEPPPPTPAPPPPQAVPDTTVHIHEHRISGSVDLNVRISGEVGVRPVLPPVPYLSGRGPKQKKPHAMWGTTGSATVLPFESTRLGSLAASVANRDSVCVTGRVFDLGAAYGRPGGSLWRFTLVGKQFADGSFTTYDCPQCDQKITTIARGAIWVWGAQVERIQRLGPKHWPVAPMISANAGAGLVTGQAVRTITSDGGIIAVEEVGARELFGSGIFPMAGAGIGIVGDFGRQVTFVVTAVGVEYPGVYIGRVGFTWWP